VNLTVTRPFLFLSNHSAGAAPKRKIHSLIFPDQLAIIYRERSHITDNSILSEHPNALKGTRIERAHRVFLAL
jgi:hypothetical protein